MSQLTLSELPDAVGHEIACSVLMPVFNEERHLRSSVAAMQRQVFPAELEFLIIDGGSTDKTGEIAAELARQDPRIRLLRNPRRGTPSGLNVGLAHARGRWVARMDAHTEYPPDYLLRGVERLQAGDTSWVSGLALARGEGKVGRAVALALKSPLGRGGSRKWSATAPDAEVELDSGVFAGVWERSTLLDYGGWDERWLRNQDSELAGRFLARGEKLVLLAAMGAHYAPRDSLRGLARQYFQYGVYRTRTARRHPDTMRRSHLLAPAVVAASVAGVAAPGRIRRVARAGLGAYVTTLGWAALQTRRQHRSSAQEAALVPAVLATMHFAHGLGAWAAAARGAAPGAALARVFGLRRLERRLRPAPEPVYAPSLDLAKAGEPAELADRQPVG